MNFKIVISDPKTRKAYQVEKEQKQTGLIGKKIGEKFSGDAIGLQGYELEVTGGSDKQGFPMRRDAEGTARKRLLLAMPPGFHPKIKGQRKRKSVRGNMMSSDIMQVNIKVVKQGSKKIEELLGVKPKQPEKKEGEKTKEEKKETDKEKTEEKKESQEKEKKEGKTKEENKEPEKEIKKKAEEKEKKDEPKPGKAEEKMGIKKLEDVEKKEEKK